MTRRGWPLVQDVMTPDPMVVHEEDAAEPRLALFERRDFNAVPVVDVEGHLVGVVTTLSLLRLFRQVTSHRTIHAAGSSNLVGTRCGHLPAFKPRCAVKGRLRDRRRV